MSAKTSSSYYCFVLVQDQQTYLSDGVDHNHFVKVAHQNNFKFLMSYSHDIN